MKKILFTLLTSLVTISAFCADVIITTKSEKLEVKIVEISSTEVKYKKINNLQGPTFVLNTNDINTIMYENGEVQVIEHQAAQPQTQQVQQPYGYQPNYNAGYNNVQRSYAGAQGYMGNTSGMIVRNGGTYLYNGQPIVLQDFLYQTCPIAYDYWRKNFIIECTGWGLLAGGVVMVAMTSWNVWPVAIIGAGFTAAGVTMGCVGNIRRTQKVLDVYNLQCNNNRYSDIRFDIKASQNGIGLAMSF